MKVLMTGSHGFVGTNLIKALSDKYEIVRWDIRSDEPIPDVDAVIHLAGKAHDTKHTTEASEYFKVNTDLTKKIFDRFLESGAKKFIFFSSIKAQDGDTPYAKSKKAAEDYILSKQDDIKRIYILRPCMIHGPGNKGNLNLLYKVVKKGYPWPLAAFNNKRSYASIGNICYIIDRLLCSDVESDIYNICDDDPLSTNELIEIICKCLGLKVRLWRVSKRLIKVIARVGDTINMSLNTERLEKLTENYIVDNRHIKHVLGINRLPISSKEGFSFSIKCMSKK